MIGGWDGECQNSVERYRPEPYPGAEPSQIVVAESAFGI